MSSDNLLPSDDVEYLSNKQLRYDVRSQSGEVFVLISDYPLPPSYTPSTCTLLLKLPPGYPNANPDMFWTTPVTLLNGAPPEAANVIEVYDGSNWQRWSRHTQQWRPGVDNLQTKLRAIQTELAKER